MSTAVQIDDTWKQALEEEFGKPYYRQLLNKIEEQKIAGKHVYPPDDLVFNAFNLTHFDELKVVIIGQDPYHGAGQAHGLSFSVPHGIKPPPSLVNIYKELHTDIGMPIPNHGNLEKWAKQGVLLLNAALSVNEGEPNSHADFGWYTFTDAVVKTISDKKEGIVFILWGKFAQNKAALIDSSKHHILTSAHPSPFSATKFFGSRHFSKTNELLKQQGKQPIDWTL